MRKTNNSFLVTGGCGFIGSHLIRFLIKNYPSNKVINFDSLTYAGNQNNLKDLIDNQNYIFHKGDLRNPKDLECVFKKHDIDIVFNLAAESHVDNSIVNPNIFAETNVIGTLNLLNICLRFWRKNLHKKLFYHISTDEVFGSLGKDGLFDENTKYDPRSPYSASKASSDHFVRAYNETYNLPTIISNCSNNYGPNQFPEKLIPLVIDRIINKKDIPVYGDGTNVRDWLYVTDHVEAINLIFLNGKIGETYCIGGDNEKNNLEIVKNLISIIDKKNNNKLSSENLIKYVEDRKGHDFRYAINFSKLKLELGWKPSTSFEKGLNKTVNWYLDNQDWINQIKSGKYRKQV